MDEGPVRTALYVLPGNFERRGMRVRADKWEPHPGLNAESQYLIGGARLVWKGGSATPGFERDARVTYTLSDLTQSTSAVMDLVSGDLLETRTTYANGAQETQRASRSRAVPPEPAGFTGKEADDEVGLVYFGERYLMPHLGRWASPDPLQLHQASGGEFGNSYHYVSGSLLQARDPIGLCGTGIAWIDAACEETFRPLGELVEFYTGGDYTHGSSSRGHEDMDGVGGVYGGAVRAATLRLVPWESQSGDASIIGGEIGASFVPVLNSLMDLIVGESVTGRHVTTTEAVLNLTVEVATLGLGVAGDDAFRSAVRAGRAPTAAELSIWRKRVRALRSALEGVKAVEKPGTRLAIRRMESFGWETVGGGQFNNSGHGVDLVFRRGDEFAVVEAKGTRLNLSTDTLGIQQGSRAYIETRLQRAVAAGKTHIGDVSVADLQRALDEGRVQSYITTTRNGGQVYQVDLSQARRRTPARARRECAGPNHGC